MKNEKIREIAMNLLERVMEEEDVEEAKYEDTEIEIEATFEKDYNNKVEVEVKIVIK
jgi:hypothetical protein